MNKYRIQVSYTYNFEYPTITNCYEIEDTSLDKAINKAKKMLSDKCNVDKYDIFVDGVELLEGEDEEYECIWGEPEYE